jgi:hypothetical protein
MVSAARPDPPPRTPAGRIVLLLVTIFFSRITKIAIGSVGEIGLATVSKLADKSAQAADSVPRAAQILKRAAAVVAERSRTSAPHGAPAGRRPPPADATLQAMIDEAAKSV